MSAVAVGLLLLTAWVALTIVLPIVSAVRASRALRTAELMREQVARLGDEVSRLRRSVERMPAGATPGAPAAAAPVDFAADDRAAASSQAVTPADLSSRADEPARVELAPAVAVSPRPATLPPPPFPSVPTAPVRPDVRVHHDVAGRSLEERIGSNWLLYVGLATLVLGVSYFLKYAFENEWITPAMRVVLGALGGLGLLVSGRRFSRHGLAFYGQMLSGGGIVLLYLAIYAALNFYRLIATQAAFAGMIAVTVLAATLAHRERSQPLAILAVTGGFVTPFLMGSRADAQHTLFAYDALLVAGTLWLARHHRWPGLHLVSFAFVGLTLVTWADVHYRPSKWLATELWITLFAVLFVLIWRTIPPATDLPTQVARIALGFTPLLYHAASVNLLWRHTAGYLVYLIAATAVGITVAGHWRRPWIRVATWVLVSLPALGWLAARPGVWDTAPLVALFGMYLLHLTAQLRETAGTSAPPRTIEVLLLHANGLWLWAGLGLLLEKWALDALGRVTFGVSGWHLALAAAVVAKNRELALHFLALAGALAAAAVAIEFDGPAVTIAWAAEGCALALLGLSSRRLWIQGAGGVLVVAALGRLAVDLAAEGGVHMVPIFNTRAASVVVVLAVLALVAWRYQHVPIDTSVPQRGVLVAALIVTAAIVFLAWASTEVTHAFARAASRPIGRDVVLSTMWAAYALLLVAIGMRRDYRPLRLLAIAIFGATVAKVFFVDLARLDRLYRILSTVGLGLLLLGASYLYQRFAREVEGRDAAGGAV